jgi:hypothetical protein
MIRKTARHRLNAASVIVKIEGATGIMKGNEGTLAGIEGLAGADTLAIDASIDARILDILRYRRPVKMPSELARMLSAPRTMLRIPTAVRIPGRPGRPMA